MIDISEMILRVLIAKYIENDLGKQVKFEKKLYSFI
jgi:hypothetical protein